MTDTNKINDGGPASNASLRDVFAMAALQGLLAQSPDSIFFSTKSMTRLASESDDGWGLVARMSYAAADAMLAERNK